ncbi:MAG: acyltransferase [Sphingomonadales bacterium]|nr:acyltransferase [Sphingomonadales bacterium]
MTAPHRIHGLDGLRGVAALSVFLFHVHALFPAFPNWWAKGYLAVDFFMMLSGYVMARTYETRMREGLGVPDFFRLRYRRMWLTMAVGGLIGIPYLWSLAPDLQTFVLCLALNLLLLPAPLNYQLFPLNGPAWSIFFELIANVLHAALFRRLGNLALAILLALLLGLLAVMARINGNVDFGTIAVHWFPALVRSLSPYLGGILLWRLWQDQPNLCISPWVPFAALPLLLSAPLDVLGWTQDLLFITLACPLLIAGGLRLNGAAPWADRLGAISFPLYAVNVPVLHLAQMARLGPVMAALLALAISIALTRWLSRREHRAKAAFNT